MQIHEVGVARTLEDALWKMKSSGVRQQTRNGPVLAILEPVIITIELPEQRVLIDPVRNANPFFHLAEFVWMMAGSNDVRFIEKYNARMREYADPNTNVHHGAYGFRWRNHFDVDQLFRLSDMLSEDPTTRRAVLGMWDPRIDLTYHRDLPCNTHIYWRVIDDSLDMTVCNRSNDLVWGCLGANAVHMTLLHELMARSIGKQVGVYHVMTNNLHMYIDRPDFHKLIDCPHVESAYVGDLRTDTFPVLQSSESMESFLIDAKDFVAGKLIRGRTTWFNEVFLPAMKSFSDRKLVDTIQATDWRRACGEWLDRRELKASLKQQQEPSSESSSPGSCK